MEKNQQLTIKIAVLLVLEILLSSLGALFFSFGLIFLLGLTIVIGVSIYTSLLFLYKSPSTLLVAIPCIAIWAVITKNVTFSVFYLFVVLAGFLIFFLIKKKQTRANSILTIALLLGIFLISTFSISYFIIAKQTFTDLINEINGVFDQIKAELLPSVKNLISDLQNQTGNALYSPAEIEELIDSLLFTIKVLIPSIFISMTYWVAFLCFYASLLLARILGYYDLLKNNNSYFLLNSVTAYVLLISYIASFISMLTQNSSPIMSYIYIIASNINIILVPIFAFVGIKTIVNSFKARNSKSFLTSIIVVCVVLLIIYPPLSIAILSFLGYSTTIKTNKLLKNINKQQEN